MSAWKRLFWGKIVLLCSTLVIVSSCAGIQIQSLAPVTKDSFDNETDMSNEYWDMITETVNSPTSPLPSIKHLNTLFVNDIPSEGFTYVYGGKTAVKVQKGTSKVYCGILACYLDNKNYSGVTLVPSQNKPLNLESLRKDKPAGLAFWAKGGNPSDIVYIGLLDDESDGMKVQTKVALRDFGKVDTSWNYYMIPLKKFSSKGKYWDESKKAELLKDVDWKKISEIRFSTNKNENRPGDNKPVKFYIEQISIIDSIPGYFDPDIYWETFVSNEPDRLLHDFESPLDQKWETGNGPASQVKTGFINPENSNYGKYSLATTYHLADWCDVMYNYPANSIPASKCDWTKYWGLKIHLFSNRPFQSLNIQISDSGNELYIASCGGPEGWSEIVVPFKDFYKFPYYQPADAVHNGKFDLENIRMLDIKPAGEGTTGTFLIDNISLTNSRVAKVDSVASEKPVTISGSFSSIITAGVNDGIFGINAQHWDSDLLDAKTIPQVKAVNHKVIRFPGGLSSDEYHWQEGLAKKDANVDTDEFLEFCEKVGCEPMITVNFGSGTPQEAAAWVEYLNIKKNRHVRYWEIGNELYGNWHKFYCSADSYGKRAVEFVNAMKKVDPSILIAAVWDLDGEWNKGVFTHLKDVVDAIVIHNYPQSAGEENDIALLSSPQTLDNIISRLKQQLADYGQKGKRYQIWLTEWNSVDFNPGPQTLSIVNGLFVADYLGMLAKHNIDQASYWAIQNGLFEQGGDYGYLSRSDFSGGAGIPRPSYWAFRMASESLRGTLVKCVSDDKKVTAYANNHKDGTKSILIINKYPKTSTTVTVAIPEFKGSGTIEQLTKSNEIRGYEAKPVEIRDGTKLKVPPYSVTKIVLK